MTRRSRLYHDQALIPIKTLAFDHAVNVTLGLPFVAHLSRSRARRSTSREPAGPVPESLIAALNTRGAARGRRHDGGGEMNADALPPLREVIRRYELTARKSLGQNFLLDLNFDRTQSRAPQARSPVVTVIEVGPRCPAGLTRALLREGAEKFIAIERRRARGSRRWPRSPSTILRPAQPSCRATRSASTLRTYLGDAPARIVANLIPYKHR